MAPRNGGPPPRGPAHADPGGGPGKGPSDAWCLLRHWRALGCKPRNRAGTASTNSRATNGVAGIPPGTGRVYAAAADALKGVVVGAATGCVTAVDVAVVATPAKVVATPATVVANPATVVATGPLVVGPAFVVLGLGLTDVVPVVCTTDVVVVPTVVVLGLTAPVAVGLVGVVGALDKVELVSTATVVLGTDVAERPTGPELVGTGTVVSRWVVAVWPGNVVVVRSGSVVLGSVVGGGPTG